MEKISIKASPKQVARLRNGHKVRISKPHSEGEGFNLLVNPANFSHISRTFARGKGTTLQLSPEELMASQGVEGRGIFSDLKKKAMEKAPDVIKAVKAEVADIAKKQNFKGRAKKALDKAFDMGVSAINKKFAGKKASAPVASASASAPDLSGSRNLPPGQRGEGFLSGLKKVAKSVAKSPVAKLGVDLVAKEAVAQGADPALVGIASSVAKSQMAGKGMYAGAGRGLYAGAPPSSMRGGAVSVPKRAIGYLGGRNQLLQAHSTLPPAMMSNPYGANFHFSTQLPPALQKL